MSQGFPQSLESALKAFHSLAEQITGFSAPSAWKTIGNQSLAQTLEGLDQFLSMAAGLEANPALAQAMNSKDITQLGDYGLTLLWELHRWAGTPDKPDQKMQVHRIVLSVSDWVVRHQGEIETLQPVVDACAAAANSTQDSEQLGDLCCLMGAVAMCCSSALKADADKSNSGRPWRLLHINRAICATRSMRISLMEKAFDQLLRALPDDAEGFFREGMGEMDRISYPTPVRDFMQRYFDRYTRPRMN